MGTVGTKVVGQEKKDVDYFLTENLGYVGLQSSNLGLFAIGTQWNPYYNIVAAVTDVYYHAASPFGYDNEGPFREEKLVRYALSFSGLNLDLGVQMKGQSGGDEDYDRVYAGVGYSYGPVYVGLGYLGDATSMEQRDLFGLGASWSVTDDLYLAVTYQSIRRDDPVRMEKRWTWRPPIPSTGATLSPGASSPTTPTMTPQIQTIWVTTSR